MNRIKEHRGNKRSMGIFRRQWDTFKQFSVALRATKVKPTCVHLAGTRLAKNPGQWVYAPMPEKNRSSMLTMFTHWCTQSCLHVWMVPTRSQPRLTLRNRTTEKRVFLVKVRVWNRTCGCSGERQRLGLNHLDRDFPFALMWLCWMPLLYGVLVTLVRVTKKVHGLKSIIVQPVYLLFRFDD